jgi:hypothetical protein
MDELTMKQFEEDKAEIESKITEMVIYLDNKYEFYDIDIYLDKMRWDNGNKRVQSVNLKITF